MDSIKCGIIGYGGSFNMGKYHADYINKCGRMTVAAICDIDSDRTEQAKRDFPAVSTYNSVDEMLNKEDIALAVVVTPHNTHAGISMRVIESGRSVVLEKPMCIATDEADELIEAAENRDVTLTVFHNRRRDGDFLAIKNIVDSGGIGDVFHIETFAGGYEHPGFWWRSDKTVSGGTMYDWGAHFVDWVLNLVPSKIESVTGFSHKLVWEEVSNEDQAQAIIKFSNGAVADIQISNIAAAGKPKWRILGTTGAILDYGFGNLTHYTKIEERCVTYMDTQWEVYYKNLAAHILDGAPLDITPQSARRVIGVIEAAGKSAASGKAEPVKYE